MGNLKKITDERYISRFFRNMARQKEIAVSIFYRDRQIDAVMFFSGRRGIEPSIRTSDALIEFHVGEIMDVTFHNSEVLFFFQTEITTIYKGTCTIKKPSILFSSFRRLMSRYTIKDGEEIFLELNPSAKHRVYDISSTGLSFLSEKKDYSVSQVIRDIAVKFKNSSNVYIDGVIKNVRNSSDGNYIYGMSFSNVDLKAHNLIFSNTFDKIHPKLKMLGDVSIMDIMNIYDKSGYLQVLYRNKSRTEDFLVKNYEHFLMISGKNMISSGLIYSKSDKFLSMGSLLRIYNRTFIGHQVVSLPETKMDPKPVNEVQSGLCDYVINHPYFKYFITYLYTDLTRTIDYYRSIENIINDSDKFLVDSMQCLECNCSEYTVMEKADGYENTILDDPDEFIRFCENNLTSLERRSYSYSHTAFDLSEINQILDATGIYSYRRVWRISKGPKIMAYAVAESYTECINLLNPLDACRIYYASESFHLKKILKTLIPDVISFYSKYGKKNFHIMFKAWNQVAKDIKMPGLEYRCPVGRVISDKEGMIEYKKYLNGEIVNSPRLYKLTHPQLAIWYTEMVYPNTNFANISEIVRIKDSIDRTLLERAINYAIQNNDGLRLRITEVEGNPKQYISRYGYSRIDFFDFSLLGEEEGLKNWDEYKACSRLNLLDNNLYYFAIFKINENEGGFYIKTHHIISDGWTATYLLISKIVQYYAALKKKEILKKRANPSYIDYILSEEGYINSSNCEEDKKFWTQKFNSVPELLSIKPITSNYRETKAERKTYYLSKEFTDKILEYCKESGNSQFSLFISILSICIQRFTSKSDMVIGTPVLNRSNQREKETAGMFISIVPLRLNVDMNMSFREYIQSFISDWKQVLKHQKYPYDLILNHFREKHKINENLYDVALSFQNAKHERSELEYSTELLFTGHQSDTLVVHVSDRDDNGFFRLDFDYLVEILSTEEVEQIYGYFIHLLEDAIINPDKELKHLNIMDESEKIKLLDEFNQTALDYQVDKTIQELFENQAEMTPDNVAVVYQNRSLTYRQLNEKSNMLARILRDKGIGPNTIVGIRTDRSLEMIIGILGVLKAGGAYLPLDPQYPSERIRFMIEDSGTKILLTQRHLDHQKLFDEEILYLDDHDLLTGDSGNLGKVNHSNDLAYLIYTSGSTGKPKGVMLEHRGMANLKEFFAKTLAVCEQDRVIQFASSSFDASVWEIFMALFSGATLFIPSMDTINSIPIFEEYLNTNSITIATLPPTYLTHINPENVRTLKKLITAGSAISNELFYKWEDKVEYINAYGPTETTICATIWNSKENQSFSGSVPIGKPIFNTKIHIIDKYDNPVPVGAEGELCISGDTLARGYLNRAELTEEKFSPNPFFQNQRMYRTGDLAKWLPDGNIEFLGRIDHQVKIRGFRIELGEIENCLLKHPEIREATVMDKVVKGSTSLCAYFTSMDMTLDSSELREFLQEYLPEYMVPSFFIKLDKLPMTPNGKVDRKALPDVEENYDVELIYEAPKNDKEEKLAEIWQQVLGIEKIGVGDNFFQLGGDSIRAIQISSALHKYGLTVELQDIYKHPTIAELSECLRYIGRSISQETIEGEVKLTPIQKWFFSKERKHMEHFNQSFMLYNKDGFDPEIIKKVFTKLIKHHDALRMAYRIENQKIIQYNRGSMGEFFKLHVYDLTSDVNFDEKIKNEANELQKSIRLDDGPLIVLGMFHTKEGAHLLIIIHHLIVDGVSWRILLEDFSNGYQCCLNKEEINLPHKTDSYKLWAEKLHIHAASQELLKQTSYWKMIEDTEIPILPKDGIPKSNHFKDSCNLMLHFSKSETENLLKHTNNAYVTEINDILLTALALALRDWSGNDKFAVNMEGHGREEVIKGIDIRRTVGWFTTIYPVILDAANEKDVASQIKRTKENLRHIPCKGFGHIALKYLSSLENKADVQFKLKPEILFNYLGQLDEMVNTDSFTISPIPSGNMVSPEAERQYVFEINGMVINGELSFIFNYNANQYFENTVLRFMEYFKNRLLEIVGHCMNKDHVEYTPSDFGDESLSMEELDEISNIIMDL